MNIEVLPGSASKVAIAPNSATDLEVGSRLSFTVLVTDLNNNSINDSKITWSVNDSIGTVSQSGVFTATRAGKGTVKATVDCPFMAAGCPYGSKEIVVREAHAVQPPVPEEMPPVPPKSNDLPPAPPTDVRPPVPEEMPPAQSQPQAPAASQPGNDMLPMLAVAIAAGIGLAAAFFMLSARKND
jgi:hypothetical protein